MHRYVPLSVLLAVVTFVSADEDATQLLKSEQDCLLDYFSSLLIYRDFCDSAVEDCTIKGIYCAVGVLCIVNAAVVLTILVTRHDMSRNSRKMEVESSGEKSTSNTVDTAICRLAVVISASCIVESVSVHHFNLPLSLKQCKCDEEKNVFVFCQLVSSLVVVVATSLLGSFAWFSSFYHGIIFVFLTTTCHTLSNLLSLFFISAPRHVMCNSTMQRVATTFVMYSAILFGVFLVRIFHKKNMQITTEEVTAHAEEIEPVKMTDGPPFRLYDTTKSSDEEDDDKDESVTENLSKLPSDDVFGAESPVFRKGKDFPLFSKPTRRRHPLSARFGTDPFLPCVVLMRKKARSSPVHPSVSNIGIGATKPPIRHAHRRASLGVIKEQNMGGEEASWARLSQRRRTSLPTAFHSSRKQAVMTSILVETSVIEEIHSTLDELSISSSSDPDIKEYIDKLQNLLKPYKSENLRPSQVVWLHDSISSTSDGSDDEDCFRGNRLNFKRAVNRRPEWSGSDSNVWTTTTSATGLPSLEPGPVKSKRIPKIQKTPSNTPHDSRCGSPVCGKDSTLTRRRTIHSIGPLHSPARSQTFFNQDDTAIICNDLKESRKMFPSSDYESCDNNLTDGNESDSRHDRPSSRNQQQEVQPPSPRRTNVESSHHESDQIPKIRMLITEPTIDEGNEDEEKNVDSESSQSGNSASRSRQSSVGELGVPEVQDEEPSVSPEEVREYFVGCEYQEQLLEKVYNWNFPIFELADGTHCVLSQMAYKLFDDTGLFESFRIPRKAFVNYMRALENGYRNIPYHNRIHAADVLHGCWYLTTQEVPGFTEISPLFSSDSSDSDSGTAHTQVNTVGNGSLAQAIPALELMALYLAAAMHDYDHPGRTNAFLVETRHPLAMLYNDRSVLENHHASASWDLLYSRKDGSFDFLVNLDVAEWKRLRFLIVEAILATDLKKHFELMSRFSSKITRRTDTSSEPTEPLRHEGCLKWTADEDRLLVCQMIIKLADIGGPTKARDLHVTWTQAICQEFFTQGDEERRLGSTVSPFMDRQQPQVAQLQKTFIKNLIAPLVCKMHRAGILAGYADEREEGDDEENILDPAEDQAPGSCRSLVREQLADNLRYWHSVLQREIPGEEEMEEVFLSAHNVTLEHSESKVRPCIQSQEDQGVSEKPLNNNSWDGYPRSDDSQALVTSNSKDGEKHKNFTKIPEFTRNFLSRSRPAAKTEAKSSNVSCNTSENKNRSKLPRKVK